MSIVVLSSTLSISKWDDDIATPSTAELECPKIPIPSLPSALPSFPPELHLKIFSNLGPSALTCLGLTCKRLYDIHVTLNGKVSISFYKHPKMDLFLKTWMGPKYIWEILCDRFVTVEEYEMFWRSRSWNLRLDEWQKEGISD